MTSEEKHQDGNVGARNDECFRRNIMTGKSDRELIDLVRKAHKKTDYVHRNLLLKKGRSA